jgi:excisionase family DNA binding protein
MEPRNEADLLYGVAAIAMHLNLTRRQVYHLAASGTLPTFKVGGKTVCARKSTLNAWLKDQEARAHIEGIPDGDQGDDDASH